MFGQTFQPSDLGIVAFLILLEGLLSADNALVLAIMVKHLPKKLQKRALLYGLGGAFFFRLIAIVLATSIISLWWLQAIGALYLLALPIKHFGSHSNASAKPTGGGFWQTVVAVELADIAFAIDSVLAGVALVKTQDKIWVVFLGAIVGIVLLRFAAHAFITLLERFPALDVVAYLLVGWVGVKLAFMAAHNGQQFFIKGGSQFAFEVPELNSVIFWSVLALISIFGTLYAVRRGRQPGDFDAAGAEAGMDAALGEAAEDPAERG